MKFQQVVAACLTVCLMTAAASAQNTTRNYRGIKLNPGERLIAVDGVPVNGAARVPHVTRRPVVAAAATAAKAATTAAKAGAAATRTAAKTAVAATNIVGNLVRSGRAFSHSPGATALEKANYERSRKGQRALTADPALMQLALHKATIAAQRSYKNHIGGSLGGARCEGVGHTQGRFLTCCLDTHGTYGGAAMVQGRDGWYCCLLVR